MGKINRSKFKSTNIDTLKQQEEEISSKVRRGGGGKDWLSIDNGANKFRIFPGHPDTSSFIYPRTVHWLPRKWKDGDGNEKIDNKPVFNARVHGNLEKDIVEEYYKFAVEKLTNEYDNEDNLQERIDIMTHWKTGILSRTEWVCYAKKMSGNSSSYGLLQITNGVKEKLNEIAITEDPDEVIETDPFTDPDNGKAIIITKNKDAEDPKDYYKVTLEFRGDYSLSDDELEWLLENESLESMYVGSYTRRDFELQLEGLEIYDNKHEFGLFSDPAWIDIVEEIEAMVPEAEDDSNESSGEPLDAAEDDFVDVEALDRKGLKKYIKDEGLAIIVKKNMSDDDIRMAIYEALEDQDVDEAVEEVEEEVEAEAEEEEPEDEEEDEEEEPEELPDVDEELEEAEEDEETSDKIKKMREKLKKGKK